MNNRIEFTDPEGLNDEQVQRISQKYGKEIPSFLQDYLKKYAGSTPTIMGKPCIVEIKVDDTFTNHQKIEKIPGFVELCSQLDFIGYLNEFASHFGLGAEFVNTEYLFPICDLPVSGVYVATEGPHVGKVYIADNGDFGIIYHSDSIDSFFEKLTGQFTRTTSASISTIQIRKPAPSSWLPVSLDMRKLYYNKVMLPLNVLSDLPLAYTTFIT